MYPLLRNYSDEFKSIIKFKNYYFNNINFFIICSVFYIVVLIILEESRYGFLWFILLVGIGAPYLINVNKNYTSEKLKERKNFLCIDQIIPNSKFIYYLIIFSLLFAVSPIVLALIVILFTDSSGMIGILALLTFPIGGGIFIISIILLLLNKFYFKK